MADNEAGAVVADPNPVVNNDSMDEPNANEPSKQEEEEEGPPKVRDNAKSRAERMAKLRDLHLKRNQARKLNKEEVVEEDRQKKLPGNWDAKCRALQWELEDEHKRKAAEEVGGDYERLKLLDMSAPIADRLDRKRKKKQHPDPGFSDYEQATYRQYTRLVGAIKPDMETYEKQREALGPEAFYASPNTVLQGLHKDTKGGIDRMVKDLEKQISKRSKYSRRRMHNDDADIDYINERNMNFNKKLERFYGKYTGEIKQNLERGTAV